MSLEKFVHVLEYNPYHGAGGKFSSKGNAKVTVAYGGKAPKGGVKAAIARRKEADAQEPVRGYIPGKSVRLRQEDRAAQGAHRREANSEATEKDLWATGADNQRSRANSIRGQRLAKGGGSRGGGGSGDLPGGKPPKGGVEGAINRRNAMDKSDKRSPALRQDSRERFNAIQAGGAKGKALEASLRAQQDASMARQIKDPRMRSAERASAIEGRVKAQQARASATSGDRVQVPQNPDKHTRRQVLDSDRNGYIPGSGTNSYRGDAKTVARLKKERAKAVERAGTVGLASAGAKLSTGARLAQMARRDTRKAANLEKREAAGTGARHTGKGAEALRGRAKQEVGAAKAALQRAAAARGAKPRSAPAVSPTRAANQAKNLATGKGFTGLSRQRRAADDKGANIGVTKANREAAWKRVKTALRAMSPEKRRDYRAMRRG